MRVKLAENIRALRKQRGLTQEQLAEATGVTVGAVHKWETGLSTPELSLIVELADYFGLSVDALLGYEMKDNRLETTLERLNRCLDEEDPEGVKEAEKALRRFPNSFDVVYRSALMLMITGGKNHDDSQLARAYGMFEQALLLTSADAGIGEISIREHMATILLLRGRGEEAAELLKAHNQEEIYSDQIGLALSLFCKKPEEAQPYLSEALLKALTSVIQSVICKAYAFSQCGDQDSAVSLLRWAIGMTEGLRQPEATGYLDQSAAYLHVLLSYAEWKKGCPADAETALLRARELAARFDACPNYDARSFRFIGGAERYSIHCLLGRTAREDIGYLLSLIGEDALTALWKEVSERE